MTDPTMTDPGPSSGDDGSPSPPETVRSPDAPAAGRKARTAAQNLIDGVLRDKKPLDVVWSAQLGGTLQGTDPRDRAFARALAATTFRRLGQIDAVLAEFLSKPLARKHADTQSVLRLGAAQLVFMDVPPHAAVDQSVSMVRDENMRKLANAVLRRVAEKGKQIAMDLDAPRLTTPDWLWDSWTSTYGATAARGMAEMHLQDPPLDLSVKSAPEEWAEPLGARLLPTGTLRRPTAEVTGLPGFADGAWWVQDVAAALPVRLLGHVRNHTVFDVCAAPGGKTLQLAAAGARAVAMDRAEERLAILRENLTRTGLKARIQEADLFDWRPDIAPKMILLDAPCSATGTIRRHPDIPFLKGPEDVANLAEIQARMLEQAFDILAPGGTLVFCTCSLQPEEGPAQIERLLEARPDARSWPIDARMINDFEEAVTRDGNLRTLPCIWPEWGGMDGFFGARIEKQRAS